MKSFKAFLAEDIKDVQWTQAVYNHIIDKHLPLFPTIIQRLLQTKLPRVKCFHICDIDNLQRLEALQGSKKAISTSSRLERWVLANPIWSGTGFIVKLTGDLLLSKPSDAMTQPDKSGMRWIETASMFQFDVEMEKRINALGMDMRDVGEEVHNIHDAVRKLANKFLAQIATVSTTGRYGGIDINQNPEDRKTAHKIIKQWFDDIEDLYNEHEELFKLALFTVPPSEFKQAVGDSTRYTESVVNNIKFVAIGAETEFHAQEARNVLKGNYPIVVLETEGVTWSSSRTMVTVASLEKFAKAQTHFESED